MLGARVSSAGTEFVAEVRAAPPVWRRGHVIALLLITLLGGVIRFTDLSSPAIWGDEGNTYSRVAGSYEDTLQLLQNEGFAPLHYELYWLINHYHKLTPFFLRLAP